MNNQDKAPQGITPNLPLWSYQLQQDSKLAVRTRKELEINLITRALKDEDFRQELIANPKALVEKELGAKLPEELEINVLEETEDTLYMVLPCNPYEGISEEELQNFVGMTYEDVARWVLEQQRSALLDEENSVRLVMRAWRDREFNQLLLTNPKAVVEKDYDAEIPEGIEIKLIEETAKKLYVVIPTLFDNLESTIKSLSNSMEQPLMELPLMVIALPGSGGSVGGFVGGGGGIKSTTTSPGGGCGISNLGCQTTQLGCK